MRILYQNRTNASTHTVTCVMYLIIGFVIVCSMSSCASQGHCSYVVVTCHTDNKTVRWNKEPLYLSDNKWENWCVHILWQSEQSKFEKSEYKHVDFTCVPAQEGGDSSFLPWSPVVYKLTTQSQCWCDRLEIMGHQNSWEKVVKELQLYIQSDQLIISLLSKVTV